MKLLTNPIVFRMVLVFLAAGFAFVLGMQLVRRMRRSVIAEATISEVRPELILFMSSPEVLCESIHSLKYDTVQFLISE